MKLNLNYETYFIEYFGVNVNFRAYNNFYSETSFKVQDAYFGTDIRLTFEEISTICPRLKCIQ